MLDEVNLWSSKWRLSLNESKTQIIHYRHQSKARSDFSFKCVDINLEYANKYRYLSVWLEEDLNLDVTVKESSKAATRALGKIIAKF